MEVFIGWSGPRSKIVANELKTWLKSVIQELDPWVSFEDTDKGSQSVSQITDTLGSCKVGIICLTPENWQNLWVNFEAGALAKFQEGETVVCTYLLGDLRPSDIKGPLSTFQHTLAKHEGTRRLMHDINDLLLEKKLDERLLDSTFDRWWPDLEAVVGNLPSLDEEAPPERQSDDMLREVLELVRQHSVELAYLATGVRSLSAVSLPDTPFLDALVDGGVLDSEGISHLIRSGASPDVLRNVARIRLLRHMGRFDELENDPSDE